MLVNTERKNVALSGQVTSREFSMKAGAHLMSVLSGLYKNPEDAMVREYLTNMYDAYAPLIKAGLPITAPILRLPTTFSPTLEFEDFGIGMDFDTAWNVYAEYGNSTKSDTNDEVGGFGLGSKTAFCYNNGAPWNVTTNKDGITNRFMAFVNEKGVPTLTHLSQERTGAPNGVKVSIPVRARDIDGIVEAAKKYLPYFPMEIQVVNLGEPVEQVKYVISGEGWGFRESDSATNSYRYNRRTTRVIMGNVPYDFNLESEFGWQEYQNQNKSAHLRFVGSNDVDLYVPIGAVDIVPSRDSLKFTDRTKHAISEAAKALIDKVDAELVRRTASCKNGWEKIVLRDKVLDNITLPDAMAARLMGGMTLPLPDGASATRYAIDKTDVATPNVDEVEDLNVHSKTHGTVPRSQVFVITKKGAYAQRVRTYIRNTFVSRGWNNGISRYGHTPCQMYLVTLPAGMTIDTFKATLDGFPHVADADTLPVVLAATSTGVGTGKSKVQVYRWDTMYGFDTNVSVDQNDKTFYYLPLDKGGSRYGTSTNRHKFERLWELSDALGSPLVKGKLYGIRKDDVSKLGTEWVNLEEKVFADFVAWAQANPDSIVAVTKKVEASTYLKFVLDLTPETFAPDIHAAFKARKANAKTQRVANILDNSMSDMFSTANLTAIKALLSSGGGIDYEAKAKQVVTSAGDAMNLAFTIWQGGYYNINSTIKTFFAKQMKAGA